MQLTATNKIGKGIECEVYDIGDSRCYKYYGDSRIEPDIKNTIDKIYSAAYRAAAAGLGPNVYSVDDCGYTTEIVQTIDDCNDKGYCGGQCEYCNDMPININLDDYHKLRNKLSDLFDCTVGDLHTGNIGIKNGQLICIDFGVGISS